MGLFVKPPKIDKPNKVAVDGNPEDYAVYDEYDEYEIQLGRHLRDPNAEQVETGNPNLRKRYGNNRVIEGTEISDDAEDPVPEVASVAAPKKIVKPNDTVKREKKYLSTEICSVLHKRIRDYSYNSGKPLGTVIEEMIYKCFPE